MILTGRDAESLNQTADDIRSLGRTATPIVADIGNTTDCERACREALDAADAIDILINNVGGRRVPSPTTEMPLETWQELIDLNLTSVFLCTKLIGGAMVERGAGGRIINISSITPLSRHQESAVAATKRRRRRSCSSLRATAVDWARHGITVNAILPGGFMTDPNKRWSRENPDLIATFKSKIPAGDFGQPEDLGPLAVYLASDAARYVTGAAMVIDGGYTLQ